MIGLSSHTSVHVCCVCVCVHVTCTYMCSYTHSISIYRVCVCVCVCVCASGLCNRSHAAHSELDRSNGTSVQMKPPGLTIPALSELG